MIVIGLFALLLLSACTESGTTADNLSATDDRAQDEAAQDDTREDVEPVSDDTSGAGGSAQDELTELLRQEADWRIAYDLTSNYDGQETTSQMTQYVKGEDVRVDINATEGEVRSYFVDETYTMCTNDGAWSCFKTAPSNDTGFDDSQEFERDLEENETRYEIVKEGTRTVAGVNTQCYMITEEGETSVTRYCIAADGAPLYIRSEDGTEFSEMIATSYSTSVPDSDFEPPAEAQELNIPTGVPDIGGRTEPAGGAPGGSPCDYCDYLTGEERDQCLASC